MRGLAWLPVFKGLADSSRFTNDSRQIAVPVVTGARASARKTGRTWDGHVCLYV